MMDDAPPSQPLPVLASPPAAAVPPLSATPTPYLVLARKYRPLGFEQLIGQEVLVRTLTNAIAQNRIAHAFILTGVRGVGKTTTARIMARAFNCVGLDGTGGPTITPCLQCSACVSILNDRNVDVIEMDAASHTGVDDIRDILESSRYKPVSVRYKVYIIDEVHMLSRNAFNALLKTLEEPPEHTKFIFATTEIRKVPVTILSRCQRFDLRRVEGPILADHFNRLAGLEHVGLDAEAATLLARAADGSVRDGLSLLDQSISLAFVGQKDGNSGVPGDAGEAGTPPAPPPGHPSESAAILVTADLVRTMLGLADRGQLVDLFATVMGGDIQAALALYDQLYQAGADPLQTGQDLLAFCHLATRYKFVTLAEAELDQESRRARQIGQDLTVPILTRAWQILLKGVSEIAASSDSRAALEMVLIRLAFVADLPSPAELIKRLTDAPGQTPGQTAGQNYGQNPEIPQKPTAAGWSPPTASASPPPPDLPPPVAPSEMRQAGAMGSPTNFTQFIEMFHQHGELILYNQLRNFCKLRAIGENQIELDAAPSLAKDFTLQINKKLQQWTGRAWQVTINIDAGFSPSNGAALPPSNGAVASGYNNGNNHGYNNGYNQAAARPASPPNRDLPGKPGLNGHALRDEEAASRLTPENLRMTDELRAAIPGGADIIAVDMIDPMTAPLAGDSDLRDEPTKPSDDATHLSPEFMPEPDDALVETDLDP